MAILIYDPNRPGEMTGHTLVNFFHIDAHSICFTDGAGAKIHSEESSQILNGTPAVLKFSIMKSSALL